MARTQILATLRRLVGATNQIAPDARLDELRYVVFDTEFTSVERRSSRLLSIGAVVMHGSKIRVGEQFYRVTNPGTKLSGASVVVHKLRAEEIDGAEQPKDVVADFLRFVGQSVLVGHFVAHDIAIVAKEATAAAIPCAIARMPAIDTAKVFRWRELRRTHYPVEAFDERTVKLDLSSAAAHYRIVVDEAHHALADAFVTAQLWQRQLAELDAVGIRTWAELRWAAR